jgi:sulfate adenylyltransferase subunit 2
MLHLARKAFFPAVPPFPLCTSTPPGSSATCTPCATHGRRIGHGAASCKNPEGHREGHQPVHHGSAVHTDMWKTQGLKQALDKYGFDAAFGGARRDEEKSRAKERVFSFRTAQHRWDPKNQRPELWRLYNARKHRGESIRVFPLSNWTELDIWQYIYLENIPIVPLYYAAEGAPGGRARRRADHGRRRAHAAAPGEKPMMKKVRFRTLGCYPLTGAVESNAETLADHPRDAAARTSEREGRVIDHDAPRRWKPRSRKGISNERWDEPRSASCRQGWPWPMLAFACASPRACCASTPAAASTTARARSSAACSTIPRRCSTTSWPRWKRTRRRSARGRARSTTRCCSTACRPSASRASPSTCLPLLLHREAQLHRRRHARARAVHAQHGHRRVDRRSQRHPDRRPQGRPDADPAPQLLVAARHPPRGAGGQQDGSGRLLAGGVRPRSRPSTAPSPPRPVSSRGHLHPDLGGQGRQHHRPLVA